MKQKNNFLQNLINSISDDYILDLYEQRFIIPKGTKSQENYIDNTIHLYSQYHESFNPYFLKDVNITFKNILKEDIVIDLDNIIILKELYKIIFLIDYTNQILDFISEKNYPNKYFASIQSDKREIKRDEKKHKSIIVNSKSQILSKGEHRLNWFFNHIYALNPKMVKYYLHIFTLIDLERCKFVKEENEEIQLKVLNFLESKLIQRTTDKDILKSLSILLHAQLKHFLKIKDTKAKEYVSEIMQVLYNYSPNDEEFNKTIYFRSSIKLMPIFGAKRTSYFSHDEKDFIQKNILKELSNKERRNFDNKEFNKLFELLLKKPHMQFLMKYPVELFRKNPKYPTI